ncbi:hypothetical protein LINPERPRIM_LOCUS20913 [Linum perenne]
MELSF